MALTGQEVLGSATEDVAPSRRWSDISGNVLVGFGGTIAGFAVRGSAAIEYRCGAPR